MHRNRRKELLKHPERATASEIKWMLSLVHEVTNLKTQIDSLNRTIAQHQTLYHNSVQEASSKGKQISALGSVLDNERKLIPEEARRKLLDKSKPGESQLCGVGPYQNPAPTAETL